MGPSRGVKFRGGAAPTPPAWSYDVKDIRAHEKYEKKVRLWQMHARHFMTDKEIGLSLYNSLRGEAEQELEFLEAEAIYDRQGVDTILQHLRASFQQKSVYIKRQYLFEYETLGGLPAESLRSYCNRYRRTEASLRAVGIDVSLTYDDESRGSRLLDRARLSLDQQRLILVGSSQSLSFDAIRAALMIQYPEHKPPPPVAGRDASTAPYQQKGAAKGSTSSSSTSTSSGGFGGKGEGFKGSRRVFQTEALDSVEEVPEPNDDPEGDDLPQEGQDEVPGDDDELGEQDPSGEDLGLNDLAEKLTAVTARKLAAVTQGRKFSGQPKRSLADKKRNSICAGCGNKGHWANDDECPLNQNQSGSSSAAPKGKGKGHKGRDDRGAVDAKKVMTVFHNTGFDSTIEYTPDDAAPNHHFAMVCTVPIFSCLTTSFQDSFGYMIMDTACQRACCGQMWMDGHEKLLKEFSLKVFYEESNEHFQFGSGQPVVSTQKAWIPAGLEQRCLSFGVNVLPSEIPLLGSMSFETCLWPPCS